MRNYEETIYQNAEKYLIHLFNFACQRLYVTDTDLVFMLSVGYLKNIKLK